MRDWLQAIWYQGGPAPLSLRPLSWLFGLLVWLRRGLYRVGVLRTERLPVPVIVVGNLTVGGTGKTPLTLWLAGELRALGLRPGIVLRGYGGRASAPQLVDADADAVSVGDEALLLARRSGCPVAVGRDRVAAARLLLGQGVQLIIADDGLQHLRLGRDVGIAVIDGVRGFGNGRLLPAGPLREPVSALARAALVVQNGGEGSRYPGALRMQLAGELLLPLQAPPGATGAAHGLPLAQWRGRSVHAVAGIGNPERFFASLRAAGLELRPHAFADHHAFSAADLAFGDDLPVLMTEKDAVKCRSCAGPQHWYLPVTAQFAAGERLALLRRVIMDARLLEFLVCPLCKGPLHYERAAQELVCNADRLAFPVRDGVPVMLEEEARPLAADDPLLRR